MKMIRSKSSGFKRFSTRATNTLIIVVVILIMGYFAMFVAVISQPSSPNSLSTQPPSTASNEREVAILGIRTSVNKQLEESKLAISSYKNEIAELSKKLAAAEAEAKPKLQEPAVITHSHTKSVRNGVVILGMHRSGTSVLGGLMNKMGLKTGGPLIQPAEDNAKGFFERIDVVLENDEIMGLQGISYAAGVSGYDHYKGLRDIMTHTETTDLLGHADLNNIAKTQKFFREGRRGLHFLNNKANFPWMLKDPRLCITFRTWIPLFTFVPAVVFTFRHPLDVALSMHKREGFNVAMGLRMWYVYNRMAIQQSNDLCRVTTSHTNVMKQPKVELDRIYNELRDECGVPVPKEPTLSDIKTFVDINLQHGRNSLGEDPCTMDISQVKPPSSWDTDIATEIKLFQECIQLYCALEDGKAFLPDYHWNMNIRA